jgi:hypothetical protein
MLPSNPSCGVALPRERNNATALQDATTGATAKASVSRKRPSLSDLRVQLRAQLSRNFASTSTDADASELHKPKVIPPEIRLLIDRVMRLTDCPETDREAFAEDWRSDPENVERSLRHLADYYGGKS